MRIQEILEQKTQPFKVQRVSGNKAVTDTGIEIDLNKANVWQDEQGNTFIDPNTERDPEQDPEDIKDLKTQIRPGSKLKVADKKQAQMKGAARRGGAVTRGTTGTTGTQGTV